jgi:hypothetical protein
MAGTNAKQLAKAVPFEKKKLTVADRKFEKEFEKLENEWDRRRKEMLDTREELVKIREAKGQTNVNQVDPSPTKSNEKFDRSISPFKSGIFPSAEITSIKLDQTLPTNPSSIHSEYERISQISPIKVSPTKSEESLGKSVHFNLTHSQ